MIRLVMERVSKDRRLVVVRILRVKNTSNQVGEVMIELM